METNFRELSLEDYLTSCKNQEKLNNFLSLIGKEEHPAWFVVYKTFAIYIYQYFEHLPNEQIIHKLLTPKKIIISEVLVEEKNSFLYEIFKNIDIKDLENNQYFYEFKVTCLNILANYTTKELHKCREYN